MGRREKQGVSNSWYKLWFTENERNKNEMGVIIDRTLKDVVIAMKRVGDKIILVKFVLEKQTINVVSTYSPQRGIDYDAPYPSTV